jgi:hypothetical protein
MSSLLAKSLGFVNNSMNRVLIPTLRGPAGRLLGCHLTAMSYTGRRTGPASMTGFVARPLALLRVRAPEDRTERS